MKRIPRQALKTVDGSFVTINKTTSSRGELLIIKARPNIQPSSPKTRMAFLRPQDPDEFENYLTERGIKPEQINLTPLSFVLTTLTKLLTERNEGVLSTDKLFSFILRESFFPPQNPEIIRARIEKRATENQPFRIGCFSCLNMKCLMANESPLYYVGQGENRLETPRINRRTQELVNQLTTTGFPFTWEFILADTDAEEIYGDWLDSTDQTPAILSYQSRIKSQRLWSLLRAKYLSQYQTDFNSAYTNCEQLVGLDYIRKSVTKRLIYFTDKVDLPDTPQIREICKITAKRIIASYAAQGPIIDTEYDCLIIADPDPTRLGMIQSLLAPQLPIWYPYPG